MQFIPIKTRAFLPPKDDLFSLFKDYLPPLKDKDVLVITSKIVAIHQGRTVKITKKTTLKDKIKLIKKEADAYLKNQPHGLTIKDHTLTPYAGIDRSNANRHYVLWPKNPYKTAQNIWSKLKKQYHLKHFGVLIIDSFCLPLRWGHMGISIGFHGFHPNLEYAGKKDIFGHKIIQANSNLVDGLSAISGVIMGEGNEQTPLLVVRGFDKLRFTNKPTYKQLHINKHQSDFYAPLLKAFTSSEA